MIKSRFMNLYEKRQEVINAIVNCTNKKSFLEVGDYREFTVPYHTMLLDALTASLPEGELIRNLNNNIALLDRSMLYATFTGSFGQRILLHAIYRDTVSLSNEILTPGVKEQMKLEYEQYILQMRAYVGVRYHALPTDMSEIIRFAPFSFNNKHILDAQGADTTMAKIHKQVQLTATIFYCDDIAELDEVGFFDFREPATA